MSPRLVWRARADGNRGPGVDGAGQPRHGAAPERRRRSSRCAGARGSDFVPACRGPPHSAVLGNEKDRVAARSSDTYAPSGAARES